MASPEKRVGFTLVEMLVVITIIGVLVGLLLPVINAARERARQVQCTNNQKELGMAVLSYENAKRRLPGVLNWSDTVNTTATTPKTTWIMAIFGDLGRQDLLNDWRGGTGTPVQVDQLICPSNKQNAVPGGLSYVVNMGVYRVTDCPFNGHNNADSNTINSRRLFRNRAVTTGAEPDFSLESLKSSQRTVMLSERLDAGPWNFNFPTTTYDADSFSTEMGKLAFAWPNPFANFPTNTIQSTRTLGEKYSGDPPTGTFLLPLLSSNHAGVVIVAFFDGHIETMDNTTKCWKATGDLEEMPPVNGMP